MGKAFDIGLSVTVLIFGLNAFASSETSQGEYNFLSDPVAWLALSFIIFLFIAFRPILKSITAMLDKRAEEIEKRLDEARQLKEEAVQIRAEAERTQHEAMLEAERIIEYAKKDAEKTLTRSKEDLMQMIKKKRVMINQDIKNAHEQAIQQIKEKTADITFEATHSLIDSEFTSQDDDALINETISKLPHLIQE